MTRIWQQEIKAHPEINKLSLFLWHPDGREGTHWTDLEFMVEVESHPWYEVSDNYALTGGGRGYYSRFHWLPLGRPSEKMEIDHIDGDRRNSCKGNLRIVSVRGNSHNRRTHGEWGPCVQYSARFNNWRVSVRFDYEKIFKPAFNSPEQAQICRDLYLEIAIACDQGKRKPPTWEELKAIAVKVRKQ